MKAAEGVGGAPCAPTPATAANADGRRAAIGSAVLLVENLLRMSVVALVSFWIARQLGPGPFGLLNLASALTAVGQVLATMGLEVPVVTRLARGAHRAALLRKVLELRLRAALVVLALVALAAVALRPHDPAAQAVVVVVALSLVAAVPVSLELAFKAAVAPWPMALARLAATLLAAAAKLAVLWAGGSLLALAWTVVLESLLLAAFTAWAYWRHRPAGAPTRAAPGTAAPEVAALRREAWPLAGAALANMLLLKLDLLMVGALADDVTTGHYALAQKICEVLYLAPFLVLESTYPLLARREAPAREPLLFDLAVAASVVAMAINLLFGPALVTFFFGAGYADTAPLLTVLGLACPFVGLDVARTRWLVAQGAQARVWLYPAAGAALALPAHALSIPHFGAVGAAAVSVAAWAFATLGCSALDRAARPLAGLMWQALWPWGRLWRRWRSL